MTTLTRFASKTRRDRQSGRRHRWILRGTPHPSHDSPESSFEVESGGGYARTVVGRVAYFDDQAQTYMVLTRAGMLVRVPLRYITSSHVVSADEAV